MVHDDDVAESENLLLMGQEMLLEPWVVVEAEVAVAVPPGIR